MYLDNAEEDPALKDEELAEKLNDNDRKGKEMLMAVFEKYAKKQDEMKEQYADETTTEEEESSSIDEEDTDISVHDLSDEDDNDNEDDINDINVINEINEINEVKEEDRNNLNTVNLQTNEVVSNKTKTDMQEKDNEVEIKTCTKGNSETALERENKITSEPGQTCGTISNTFVAVKNIKSVDTKTQKDTLSSTTNCISTIDRIEGL